MSQEITALMHKTTLDELSKFFDKIYAEKKVHFTKRRQGAFDFFVEENGKTIGFEVLSRPTRAEMKRKLIYADYADAFVFVILVNAMNFYKREKTPFVSLADQLSFGKEFDKNNLSVGF